jgi:NTE family protein
MQTPQTAHWAHLVATVVLCGAVLVLSACAHYPVNPRLEGRVEEPATPGAVSDDLLLVLAFSGGGTRAAAMSYGVLETLAATQVIIDGRPRRLLDEVDLITSVSGGSVTAAYYGLYGDRIFADFNRRFLTRDLQGELSLRFLNPVNWFRLLGEGYDRVDLAADYLDTTLFDGAKFADLARRAPPVIVINATDMLTGTGFAFTQQQFDLLCSNLGKVPVARAVAASSAFPFVLSPIRLRNYAGSCGYRPSRRTRALADQPVSTPRRMAARAAESYLDASRRPYIHLLDGGIADDLGLRGLLDPIAAPQGTGGLLERAGLNRAKRIVFIVVNAEAGPDTRLSVSERSPSPSQVFRAVTTAQISRFSSETVELLRERMAQWAKRPHTQTYLIDVDFNSLADASERQFFKSLPTRFSLPAATVTRVRSAAARLLRQSPTFRQLVHDVR